jgi:hypothetical protein
VRLPPWIRPWYRSNVEHFQLHSSIHKSRIASKYDIWISQLAKCKICKSQCLVFSTDM